MGDVQVCEVGTAHVKKESCLWRPCTLRLPGDLLQSLHFAEAVGQTVAQTRALRVTGLVRPGERKGLFAL